MTCETAEPRVPNKFACSVPPGCRKGGEHRTTQTMGQPFRSSPRLQPSQPHLNPRSPSRKPGSEAMAYSTRFGWIAVWATPAAAGSFGPFVRKVDSIRLCSGAPFSTFLATPATPV